MGTQGWRGPEQWWSASRSLPSRRPLGRFVPPGGGRFCPMALGGLRLLPSNRPAIPSLVPGSFPLQIHACHACSPHRESLPPPGAGGPLSTRVSPAGVHCWVLRAAPKRTSASRSRGLVAVAAGPLRTAARPCPLPLPPVPQASLCASEHEEGPLGQWPECILMWTVIPGQQKNESEKSMNYYKRAPSPRPRGGPWAGKPFSLVFKLAWKME